MPERRRYLKPNKRFLNIPVGEELYAKLIDYSKRNQVSYNHMARDAFNLLIQQNPKPSIEENQVTYSFKK